MNHDEEIEALAAAWTADTVDLTSRISAATGAGEMASPIAELLGEIRAMREEINELRGSAALLQDEIYRLRSDLSGRNMTRIAPYAPTEGLIRLS